MNVAFPPPQHWQDFENLTVEVFRAVFDDPGAQGHGRSGQAQYGVDVFGRELGRGRLVGIQCKRKSATIDLPGSTLSMGEIRAEVAQAETFNPKIDYLILATTGPRDAGLQRVVAYENEKRIAEGNFPIGLWFWEDYVGFLNNNAQLQQWYSGLLNSLYGESLADLQILTVMRTAVSRAAFRTPLHIETAGEFRQALLDTCRAVDTGLLLDRETRMPICRAPAGLEGLKSDPNHSVGKVLRSVHSARTAFDEAVGNGEIQAGGSWLIIQNNNTRKRIDGFRAGAIRELNTILSFHGIEVVESPLLAENPFNNVDADIDDTLSIATDLNCEDDHGGDKSGHSLHARDSLKAVPTNLSLCRLDSILSQSVAKSRRATKAKNIRLRISYNGNEAVRLMADENAMQEALGQIVENGVKYAYNNTDLEVTVQRHTDGIAITFEDVGVAFPSQGMEFYREDRWPIGRSCEESIGLFLAQQTIAAHKGTINIQSRPTDNRREVTGSTAPHRVRVTVFLPSDSSSNKKMHASCGSPGS